MSGNGSKAGQGIDQATTGEPDPLLTILDEYFRRLETRDARLVRERITPDEDTRRFVGRFLHPPLTPEEAAELAAGIEGEKGE